MSLLQNSNAISSGSYNINNSLRFRASASAYLNRTPASTTNRQTWTWSGWVKRGVLGARQHIFISANPVVNTGGQQEFQFAFNSSDQIEITGGVSGVGQDLNLTTTQVFRDPSAWYHFVVLMDTTQATSSNRMKFYLNGVQVTAFGTAIYPAQNHNTAVNLINFSHRIGGSGGSYLDAYQAEINFIDGQALTPSSFGETDTDTGSWKPKAYTGTYGTNGFYLKFSDIATTSGSNAGLGKDFSGNSNYWTTNNISVTAGTTYDAMTDSPTLTSATVANYCVLNPLEKLNWLSQNGTITLNNANMSFDTNASGAMTQASFAVSSGKWYFEATLSNFVMVGIRAIRAISNGDLTYRYYQNNGQIIYIPYNSTTQTVLTTVASSTSSDIIGVAFDLDSNTISWYKNGTLLYTATGIVADTYAPSVGAAANQTGAAVNFGQRPFSYTPPTGYKALNTYNLPDSTIKKGNLYMDASLWTGNGASNRTITNTAGFKPDLVWTKGRNTASWNHFLNDSVRGFTNYLISSSTGAEGTTSPAIVSSAASNGFVIQANGNSNNNGDTYVGWQWQAGQGSTSSNTNGSITSTVSVNATAGFSIVTYTGTGANATVGHGLGVAPRFIIVKQRGTSGGGDGNWIVGSTAGIGWTGRLILNGTFANEVNSTHWNNTAPTSTVFSLGTSGNVNGNTGSYVAYCWAEIAGYSKFGSYTGNGVVDGPFVYTGFRPKFVIVKPSNFADQWMVFDSSRNTYNVTDSVLYPNLTNAEASPEANNRLDFLSNGFKIRGSGGTVNYSSSTTIIYMAFAESPFKSSLAR